MANKISTPAPLPIVLTIGQLQLFETFFQYGDLANANLIFMGLEEGLDRGTYPKLTIDQLYSLAIDARRELCNNKTLFGTNKININGKNDDDGWYIKDSACL